MERNEGRISEHGDQAFKTNDHTSAAASRKYCYTLRKQEKDCKDYMQSFIRNERTSDSIQPPIADSSSPNARHTLAEDFRSSGTFDKQLIVPVRHQVKSGCIPKQKSIRNTVSDLPKTRLIYESYQTKLRDFVYVTELRNYLYRNKLCDYIYLTKIYDFLYPSRIREENPGEKFKLNEENFNLFRYSVKKINHNSNDHSSQSTSTTVKSHLRRLDTTTHHLTLKEPTRVKMYREKNYTQRNKNARKSTDSGNNLGASKEPFKKVIEYKEGRNRLRLRETGSGIHNPSSTNAKTVISPEKGSQFNITFKEPTANTVRHQMKTDALSMEDSSRSWGQQLSDLNMYLARLSEKYPEEQSNLNKLKFSRRTVVKNAEGDEDSNYHPLYSAVGSPFYTSDVIPSRLKFKEPTGVNRYHGRRDARRERDSSKDVGHQVTPGASKIFERKQINYEKDQLSLGCKETTRDEEIRHANDHYYSSKGEQIPSESDKKHCVEFIQSTELVDECHMRISNSCMQDPRRVNRPRISKEHPEEQALTLGHDQCHDFRHLETRKTDSILNFKGCLNIRKRLRAKVSKVQVAPVTVIDPCQFKGVQLLQDSNRYAESGISSDELLLESNPPRRKNNQNRLSRRIENIWSHLCTNGIIVAISFMMLCIILLIFKQLW